MTKPKRTVIEVTLSPTSTPVEIRCSRCNKMSPAGRFHTWRPLKCEWCNGTGLEPIPLSEFNNGDL